MDTASIITNLKEQIGYVLALVALWVVTDLSIWVKKRIEAKKLKRAGSIESTMEKHLKLERILSELRHDTEADRCYLAQLHNGLITSARMHMYKFSMSHEVCGVGVSREKETIRNIQVEDHLLSIKQLIDNRSCIINDIALMDSGMTKALLTSMGVESAMYISIHDRSGTLVGFMAVEWVDKPRKISKDDKLQASIIDQANLLQLALLG